MDHAPDQRAAITRTGSFAIPLDPADAIELFTAEGERLWVEGWDPRYPAPGGELGAVGSVFVTRGAAGDVVWVVTHTGELERHYARFDHAGSVGSVEVRCTPAGDGTAVEVTYRLTAVNRSAEPELARFAREYPELMRGWRAAIERAIEHGAIASHRE